MKKFLILTVCVLAGLCMVGCNKNTQEDDKVKNENYEIIEAYYMPNLSEAIYPTIQGLTDSERQVKLNKIIADEIMNFTDSHEIVENNGRVNINHEVKLKNSEKLSVLYKGEYTSDAVAYPLVVKTTINLDLASNSKMYLKDMKKIEDIVKLITDGNFTVTETDETIKQAQIDYIKGISSDDLTTRLNNVDTGKDSSYMTEDSIVIVLEVPHAIGDYAEYVISK